MNNNYKEIYNYIIKLEEILSIIKLVFDIISYIVIEIENKNNILPTQTSLTKYSKFNNLQLSLSTHINNILLFCLYYFIIFYLFSANALGCK